ncbi:hypothetical protein [Leptolyngbya sp. FACHB-711]|uniref:hypothetical protein n=1 Tax=Leptolyngbya sp. FACHB-711 TaxID=2692813 RepID=UPI001682CEE8|nr:hypothetical protein [Leptolyngbya sp. FACHB-711]MBD2023484.1 hypothetical protein [Leptolyngbya sp. FACHB-711]
MSSSEKAKKNLDEAFKACNAGEFDKAIQLCEVVKQLYENEGDTEGQAACLINIGNILCAQAIKNYYQQGIALLPSENRPTENNLFNFDEASWYLIEGEEGPPDEAPGGVGRPVGKPRRRPQRPRFN